MKTRITQILAIIIMALLPSLQLAAADNAPSIVGRAVTKFQSAPSLTIRFDIKAHGQVSTGTMTVAGDRFRLDLGGMLTWYDGRDQWTYIKADNEITITQPTVEELAQINPFAIISSIRGRFNASLISTDAHTDNVAFTPRSKASAGITNMTVKFNKTTSWPTEITIVTDNGETGQITVKSVTPGGKLPVSNFSCNTKQYPKAEIIDLR